MGNLALYFSFFLFSTFKFLFAPLAGPAAGLNFWETYVSCVLGAIFSAFVFYYSGSYFIKKSFEAKRKKDVLVINKKSLKVKKNFTKTNKFIVKLKRRFGIYGISFYAPLFLSVPVGSIITAKFFRHEKKTFVLIIIGILKNGIITTSIAYFFSNLISN